MNKKIIKKRVKLIRDNLSIKAIDCLIVTKPANVTYITAFSGDDSWAIITKTNVYLLTDSRYTEQAEKQCLGCKIIQRPNSTPIAQAAAKLIKKLKPPKTIAIEKSTSIADFELIKKNIKTRLKIAPPIVETIRSCKDDTEIAAVKTAATIAAKALKQILQHIKPGVTENELAGLLNFQIRKLGATTSFETIVAFGPNASRPHHQPGRKKLRKKDTILIDFGAKYNGYCCDITRCLTIGSPTTLYKKVFDSVEKSQAAAIENIKAGVEISSIDTIARKAIANNGLPVYEHGTGHGIGLEIHELPFLRAQGKGKLQPGQIITIEPGVYIPGKLGVRIEDDILVTEAGHQILSHNCPHFLKLPV